MTDIADPARFDAEIRLLETEFTHLFSHMRRLFRDSAHRVSPGMLPGSYKVLTCVAAEEPITASAIAERLSADKGQLSRMIKDLVGRDLIVRTTDPSDRRSTVLSLSEHGRERMRRGRRPTREGFVAALSQFDPSDLATASRVLRALYEQSSVVLADPQQAADGESA